MQEIFESKMGTPQERTKDAYRYDEIFYRLQKLHKANSTHPVILSLDVPENFSIGKGDYQNLQNLQKEMIGLAAKHSLGWYSADAA